MNMTLAPGVSLRRIAEIIRNATLFGADAGSSVPERQGVASERRNLLPTERDVVDLFTLLQQRRIAYLLVGGVAVLRYVEPLFERLAPHLLASDLRELRAIVNDIHQRLARFDQFKKI